MKTKLIFYALFLPVLLLIFLVGHLLYNSYIDYKGANESKASILLTKNIGKSIISIANEIDSSSVYFASKGTLAKQEVQKAREKSDSSLIQILDNQKDGFDLSNIKQVKQDLIGVRSSIDTLSGEYSSIVSEPYIKNIADPILATMHKLHLDSNNAQAKTFGKLLKYMLNIVSEKALVEYYAITKKRMTNSDLLLFESYTSKDIFPKTYSTFDGSLDKTINKLLTASPKELKMLNDTRADMFIHSISGSYSIDKNKIDKVYGAFVDRIGKAVNIISKNMGKLLQNKIETSKNRMSQYAIALAILLIIFILLLRAFRGSAKEKKELEKVLREMVSDLDKERQDELNTIIKKGDTVAIYHFLAKIIQDANEAKKEAIEAEKAKDLFLANMSHEIRTPLNGILGFAQLLQGTELNSEQEEFLQVINTSSNNLLKIVNDILDLSKIKVDKMDLEEVPFNATEVLIKALEPHETKASDKKIEYTTYIDPYLPDLVGDPTKLSQVMTNLIGNAMKFTDYHGSVEVSIEKVKETPKDVTVRFSIKDDGIGVSPEQKERIFQPFSQADISTTRKFGGTGLGLTITKTLIEKMGGELELDSEIGKGSEFYFTITFKKSSQAVAYDERFGKLFIGYFKPIGTPTRKTDTNLKAYIKATGAAYEEFNELDSGTISGYDVVITDYAFEKTRENIDLLSKASKHLVVMIYISYSDDARAIQNKVNTIIYKPINMIKITKSLEKVISKESDETLKSNDIDNDFVSKDTTLEGAQILVAEDNEINQKLIKNILDDMGAEVTLANNGQEAVELYKDNNYDIVFMDIQMPILGGIEATDKIILFERKENRPHTPIIALTANVLRGDREKYLKAGMDDYISKPIVLEEMKSVIGKYYKPKESVKIDKVDEKNDTKSLNTPKNRNEIISSSDEDLQKQKELHSDKKSNNILIYSKNSAVCKMHKSVLSHYSKETDCASDLESFIESAESKEYSFVLVSSNLIDEDLCIILESMSEIGITPLIYGDAKCSNDDLKNYKNFDELKELLN